jgi:hypothetical protein
LGEERRERLRAEALARLDDRTAGHRLATRARRQHQVEMAHDFPNRAIAQQAHTDHEPHHVLGRQLPPSNARRARCSQRLRDPRRLQRLAEQLETRRALARADGEQSA